MRSAAAAGNPVPRRVSAAAPLALTAVMVLSSGGVVLGQEAPRPAIAREKPAPSGTVSAQDLARLRLQLVRLAEQERAQDAELAALEALAAPLEAEERTLSARLDADRARIAQLLVALQRLSRLPPETALVRPGTPLDTLRSTLMLRDMVPLLRQRSEALAQSLQHLADTRRELDQQRARILAARLTLAERRRTLDEALKRRDALRRPGEDERHALAQQMARLGNHAGDLRQLMERMEADRHAAAAAAARRAAERAEEERRLAALQDAAPPVPPPPSGAAKTPDAETPDAETPLVASLPVPALPPPDTPPDTLRGGLRLPVGGRVVIAYGASDHTGNPSRGITVATHPGATVTAPFAGTVMFAGPFRNYGQILIVEHGNGYHSLIAGLGRIDTAVGTHVATGEPIGRTLSPSDESAEVYFELRRHGQPTNPANGFAGPEGKGQG